MSSTSEPENNMGDRFLSNISRELVYEPFDIEIVVGKKIIPAHRRMLVALTDDYFKAMFTHEWKETNQPKVKIRGVDKDAVEQIIKFAYTSLITINEGNVRKLLEAAIVLRVEGVTRRCCEFFKNNLDPSNCIGFQSFAEDYSLLDLLHDAKKFTMHHFHNVMQNDIYEFLLLPVNKLKELIRSDELNVRSEVQLFTAVMKWVESSSEWIRHKVEHNEEPFPLLPELLILIRLPLIRLILLERMVKTHPLICNDNECLQLVEDAKTFRIEGSLTYSPWVGTHPRKPQPCARLLAFGRNKSARRLPLFLDPPNSFTVEQYIPETNEWQVVKQMNRPSFDAGVAFLNGFWYTTGGMIWESVVNISERYDPKVDQWHYMAPMSTPRRRHGVAVMNGLLYVVGGDGGWFTYHKTVERYNPNTNRWKPVTSMKNRRSGLSVAVLGGCLYAIGGMSDSSMNKIMNSVERYDPKTKKWAKAASMNIRRHSFGCAVYNNHIYVVGGYLDYSLVLRSIERYDPINRTWNLIGPDSSPGYGIGIVVCFGEIIDMGHSDGEMDQNKVQKFGENSWQLCGMMESCRRKTAAEKISKFSNCECGSPFF